MKKFLIGLLAFLGIVGLIYGGIEGYGYVKNRLAADDPFQTGITTSIDRVLVSIKPDESYAGKYIIKPRCDNVNLRLICDGRTVRPNPIQIVERGIGIACPPEVSDGDPNWGEEYIDVVKLPNNAEDIVPLYVECSMSRLFDLTPPELGITGDPEGKSVNCILEGRFSTVGIEDLATDVQDLDPKYDYCREDGKVPLEEVQVNLKPVDVFLAFPAGHVDSAAMVRNGPWLFKGHLSRSVTPDWSRASKLPLPKSPHEDDVQGDDNDGFGNTSEDDGFNLANSMSLSSGSYPDNSSTHLPPCSEGADDPDRPYCVHRLDQEVFTIIHPLASNSMFPNTSSLTEMSWYLEKIAASKASYGLSIKTHFLTQPQPSNADSLRQVNTSDNMTAIRIVEAEEDLSTGSALGESEVGVPNDAGVVTVYTVRIRQKICDLCGGTWNSGTVTCTDLPNGGENCKSASPITADATDDSLYKEYTKYVIHHEVGHSLNLVVDGGYNWHHLTGDWSLYMMPDVDYSKKGRKVTFYIPYKYCSDCQSKRDLTTNQ